MRNCIEEMVHGLVCSIELWMDAESWESRKKA